MANVAKKKDPDVACPLFADAEPPIYAKDVGRIRLFRFEKSSIGSRGGKVPLPKDDYYVNGDEDHIFELDPYETTEEDLQQQFGAGEYWIDAVSTTQRVIPGGRRIMLGGVVKRAGVEVEEEDEEEERSRIVTPPAAPTQQFPGEMLTLFQTIMADRDQRNRDQIERERHHAAKEAESHNTFAATMFQIASARDKTDGSASEVVAALRSQLDAANKKSISDEDALRKSHRDEIARRDRELEEERKKAREDVAEERRRAQSDRERLDREIDDMRRTMGREEMDLRARYQKDNDELRARYERDLAQSRNEMVELRVKLTKEVDETRTRLERRVDELDRQVHTLKTENIDLERALAKADTHEPSAPVGPSIMEQFMPMAQQAISAVVKKAMENPPPGAQQAPTGYEYPNDPQYGYVPPPVPMGPPPGPEPVQAQPTSGEPAEPKAA